MLAYWASFSLRREEGIVNMKRVKVKKDVVFTAY